MPSGAAQPSRPRAGQVHLWRAALDLPDELLGRFDGWLSPDEHERAQRLHRDGDRRRFIAGRGWLRLLLARYLGVDPAAVVLAAGPAGKPCLGGPLDTSLRFNLAHSGALVAFAIAAECEVGVDVEMISGGIDVAAVAAAAMSARQRAELEEMPAAARTAAFFRMWTRNEAYLKGVGSGFRGGQHDLDATPGWSVRPFDVGPGYAAAVALAGSGADVPEAAAELPPW